MVRVIFFVMMGSRQKLLNDVDGNREKMQAAGWMLPWMLDLGCWMLVEGCASRSVFNQDPTSIREAHFRRGGGRMRGWGHVVIVILSSRAADRGPAGHWAAVQ